MNDHRLSQADPFDLVRDQDLGGAPAALLDEIVRTPDAELGRPRASKQRTLRSSLFRAGVAAAAVTALIAGSALLNQGDDNGPSVHGTRFRDAAMVKVAQENPRILITADGWKVRDLEGFSPENGAMRFQRGPDQWHDETFTAADGTVSGGAHLNAAPQVAISWYPSSEYESYVADRAHEPGRQEIDVLGHRSQMVSYSASDHAVMLPPQGKVFIEIRSSSYGDEAAFKSFLAHDIEQVDVDTWLAALPDSIITPDQAVEQAGLLLTGIALPPGFDAAAFASGEPLDHYQFGAEVVGAVACGWLDEWVRAHRAGDAAAAKVAADALGTSKDWKVLRDMDVEGDYPEVLGEYVDKVVAGTSPTGYKSGLGCQ